MLRFGSLILLFYFQAVAPSFANYGNDHGYAIAEKAWKAIRLADSQNAVPPLASSLKLHASPPLDQKHTGLCWVYATLSALETNHFERTGEEILLSRRWLQYLNMRDRIARAFLGERTNFSEGGNALDAIRLARSSGLRRFDPANDVYRNLPYKDLRGEIARENSFENKTRVESLLALLFPDAELGAEPRLADSIFGKEEWIEFAPNDAGKTGFDTHPDADARADTFAYYVARSETEEVIVSSLRKRRAVIIGVGGHIVMIYGVDFDKAGRPRAYHVKDSYAHPVTKFENSYFYSADPEKVARETWAVTVIGKAPESAIP